MLDGTEEDEMFGFSREQWTSWIMGGVISYLVARALQFLWTMLGGLNWAAGVSALSNPNVQASLAELLLPAVLLAIYFKMHRGKLSFEPIAKITICSMCSAYLLVFAFNLPRPDNPLVKQMLDDPVSALFYFFIPIFYLMHSVLKTIETNHV
jgi:hypothetical protein